MKMSRLKNGLLVLLLAGACVIQVNAQTKLYINKEKSSMEVNGTSSLHDWEMEVNDFGGFLEFVAGETGLELITNAGLTCKTESIKADNRIMDGKAHDALKSDKNPTITFTFSSIENLKSEGAVFSGIIHGDLTLAGKTNAVSIPFDGTVSGNNEVTVKGSFPLNETDYGMEPPTALMGTLKTGPEVKIVYEFMFAGK